MKKAKNSDWNFPLSIPSNPLKREVKNIIGQIIMLINPKLRNELLSGKIPKNTAERAALMAIFIDFKDNYQSIKMSELHKKIWASSQTQGYYDLTSNRLRGMFEAVRSDIEDSISNLVKDSNYDELIEFGCGEGIVTHELSIKFKEQISQFVGIDINEKQIQINRSTYNINKNIKFDSADLNNSIDPTSGSNKIYLTFGGVFEYLTEVELLSLLKKLAKTTNIAIILYEPIEPGFNITNEKHSIVYGSEYSFSHPYHHYLLENGFKIISEKHIISPSISYVLMVAKIS